MTLKVVFGASLAASSGHDKKGGSAKGGVEVQASEEETMVVIEQLHRDRARELREDAQEGEQGATEVDATFNELAIISVGASQTWEIAKQMFKGGGAVGKRTG